MTVGRGDSLQPSGEEWTALAEQARNIFGTWEFADVWWKHFGGGAERRLRVLRDPEGSARAILPLVLERRGPVRLLRFLGHGPADELGPICAQADRVEAARALRAELDAGGWDVFAGELLSGDWPWPLLGGRIAARQSTPVIRFGSGDWDAYLLSRTSNFRQLLRRKERRVLAQSATYRLADESSLARDLDTLFELHRQRWHGRGTVFERHEVFHRDFAPVALERGWLRLWIMEIEGERAAAWYGFRFAGAESYYQAGRAAKFDPLSPGIVLLAHTVREAQRDGMTEYRFLRGDESYKRRFADDDPGLATVVEARGALGHAAVGAVLAVRRLRRAAARRPLGLLPER